MKTALQPLLLSTHIPGLAILGAMLLSACASDRTASLPPSLAAQALQPHAVPRGTVRATANGYTILHSFTAGRDGNLPSDGLTSDGNGNLYGTTLFGGGAGCPAANPGCGVVFKISNASSSASEQVVYAFKGGSDGSYPLAPLSIVNGTLYGTTSNGGSNRPACNSGIALGCGTVFAVSPASATERVIYRFLGGTDGAAPESGLTLDSVGNLYGSIESGLPLCVARCGMIYRITPDGNKTVVGSVPSPAGFSSAPTLLNATTLLIPGWNESGCGTQPGITRFANRRRPHCSSNGGALYQLSPTSSTSSRSPAIVYTFGGASQGSGPDSPVVVAPNGTIYGTTIFGGLVTHECPQGCGTVYRLTPTGQGSYDEDIIHQFAGGPHDGALPLAITLDPTTGTLYGTTEGGGVFNGCDNGCGIVYALSPQTTTTYSERILHVFSGAPDGWSPQGGLDLVNGVLYGTTAGGGSSRQCGGGCGTVFRLQL